jgi:hypothetical protein
MVYYEYILRIRGEINMDSDKIGKNKPFMILGYAFTAVLSP